MRLSDFCRLIALSAVWGASFLFMRMVSPVLGVLPTAFFRVLLGALGLAAILAAMRVRWRFNGKFTATLALGAINSGLPFVMYCVAARVLPAGYSAILNATTPLMGVIIGAAFFAERLSGVKALGVVVGLAGVAVLTRTGPVAFSPAVLFGALACLAATACYGLAGFLTRRWINERGGLDARLVAFGSQMGASLFVLPFFAVAAIFEPPVRWGGTDVWFPLLALGLLCTALAYILYFRLIADIGPVKSLTVTFAIPPFGVLWGALFLHEAVTWAHFVGGALVMVALWLVLKPVKPDTTASAASAVKRAARGKTDFS